ncbi:MAG TPA: phosphoribosylglycinamide formyltransferase [Candidatus Altiarchaeales archaeon]|nr:MAG: phosphoribosylglycinamide formyltransferase [Candidatus Altiarchaeales archaeon]HDN83100.1 phosphoribosylglycinamide formyltransferase [Candidatus Altiarchaeales archaeon]
MPKDKLKIGVLASTRGTDLQAIIDEIEQGKLDAEVSVVISDRPDAYALERARKHGIEAIFIDPKGKTREEFDREVMKILDEKQVDVVALIGYMRILSKEFVRKYKNRIMNVHPSLLPAFAGGMDKNVHKAVLDYGVKVTGCTIHFVDETVDGGPIILQAAVPVEEDDTVDTLKEKVQALEKKLYPEALRLFHEGRLKIEGRRVRILPKKKNAGKKSTNNSS